MLTSTKRAGVSKVNAEKLIPTTLELPQDITKAKRIERIRNSLNSATVGQLMFYRDAGEDLYYFHQSVGKRHWRQWLKNNAEHLGVQVGYKQAMAYKQLFESWHIVKAALDKQDRLTLEDALELIREKSGSTPRKKRKTGPSPTANHITNGTTNGNGHAKALLPAPREVEIITNPSIKTPQVREVEITIKPLVPANQKRVEVAEEAEPVREMQLPYDFTGLELLEVKDCLGCLENAFGLFKPADTLLASLKLLNELMDEVGDGFVDLLKRPDVRATLKFMSLKEP